MIARTKEVEEEFLATKAKLLMADEMMKLALGKKKIVKEENEEPVKNDISEIKNEEE